MTSRTRFFVLVISTPVIAFAIVGGFLGQAMTRDETYQHLRVFEDVVSLVLNNYVEEVDVNRAMKGAMNGLADGLDADSAYLTPILVKDLEANDEGGAGDVGLELTRQYYLRVISARDGSPAAKAGLRTGDYVRRIDTRPTRDMSAFEGMRLLRGAPGTKGSLLVIRGNAADPHVVDLVRERTRAAELTSRMADAATGYIRIAEISRQTPTLVKQSFEAVAKTGAKRYVIDVRGTARGDIDDGIATARLFVKSGTLTIRQTKGDHRESVPAQANEGAIEAPVVLLVDSGTSGSAEVFAAALKGNARAERVGGRTFGRASRQRLGQLPHRRAPVVSHLRYLAPARQPPPEKGLPARLGGAHPRGALGSGPAATGTPLPP